MPAVPTSTIRVSIQRFGRRMLRHQIPARPISAVPAISDSQPGIAAKCGKVFTVEEHSIIGGLGDAVASAICGMGLKHFEKIGINDVFGQSGKPAALLEEYGLTGKQIADRIAKA